MQKMRKHSWCGALILVIALWWAAPLPVYAIPFTPAVEYVTSDTFTQLFPLTLGYQFNMSVPFTVDALAYFDDGFFNNHLVGIWNSVGDNVIYTTVLASDPVEGHFQYASFTPITLPAGDYTIGGEYHGLLSPFPSPPLSESTLFPVSHGRQAYFMKARV